MPHVYGDRDGASPVAPKAAAFKLCMLFAVTPGAANGQFRWRGRLYHATYKGHIDAAMLRARLGCISSVPVLGWSCVHEESDAEAPYAHTHFAWVWERAVDLQGCHLMDVNDGGVTVHPNIETKKSIAWMELVFTRYHAGHKHGADGKPTFTAPVAGPWQQLPAAFEWSDYILSEVSSSPDLQAGCALAGIRPKTVNDVLALQSHKRPAPFDHNYSRDQFKPLALPAEFVSRQHGTLQIYGGVGLGKTEWACAQFDNPLLVTTRDGLRGFKPGVHDGIVLDKMLFNDWTVTDAEALTDWTQPAQIKCRYHFANIPKRTVKIVVTNRKDAWPTDPFGQLVGRRISQLEIKNRLY